MLGGYLVPCSSPGCSGVGRTPSAECGRVTSGQAGVKGQAAICSLPAGRQHRPAAVHSQSPCWGDETLSFRHSWAVLWLHLHMQPRALPAVTLQWELGAAECLWELLFGACGAEWSAAKSVNHVGKSLTIPSTAEVVGFALSSGRLLTQSPVE